MYVLQRNHAAHDCLSWIGTVGFLRIPLDHFDVCRQEGIEGVRHDPIYPGRSGSSPDQTRICSVSHCSVGDASELITVRAV
jgi:hypothetical protein